MSDYKRDFQGRSMACKVRKLQCSVSMKTLKKYKVGVIAGFLSIAVGLGFAFYEGYLPVRDAQKSLNQAAGRLPTNEEYLKGGVLQRNLSGEEKAQEFITERVKGRKLEHPFGRLSVHAGKIVNITFENDSKHGVSESWLLVKPGTRKSVETEARKNGSSETWYSQNTDVLAFVPDAKPGEKVTRLFRAPEKSGNYPILFALSGSGAVQRAVLHVIE